MYFKFWKETESFDYSKSHEFEPSEELSKYVVEQSQYISFDDEMRTVKMRKCKHNQKWKFTKGMPSNIIGCCNCDYWQFI